MTKQVFAYNWSIADEDLFWQVALMYSEKVDKFLGTLGSVLGIYGGWYFQPTIQSEQTTPSSHLFNYNTFLSFEILHLQILITSAHLNSHQSDFM